MALPTKGNLLTLDWAWRGQPFVQVPAKSGIVTTTLDTAWRGQPFVAVEEGAVEEGAAWALDLSNGISFSDALSKAVGQSLSDGISFSDALSIGRALTLFLSDGISFSDALSKAVGQSLSDGISFSDVLSAYLLRARLISMRGTSTSYVLTGASSGALPLLGATTTIELEGEL